MQFAGAGNFSHFQAVHWSIFGGQEARAIFFFNIKNRTWIIESTWSIFFPVVPLILSTKVQLRHELL